MEPLREPCGFIKLLTLFVSVLCSAMSPHPSKPRILLYRKERQDKSRLRSDKSRARAVVNRLKEIDRSSWKAT